MGGLHQLSHMDPCSSYLEHIPNDAASGTRLLQGNARGRSMGGLSLWLLPGCISTGSCCRAQGGGERARRLRGQHRSSVPMFTIKPLGSQLPGGAAASPGNPGSPSAAAAAWHLPQIAARAAAEGDENAGPACAADARAPCSAALRMSCPVGPAAHGRAPRTPLVFRCAHHSLLERAAHWVHLGSGF